jgi:hypothetical protein
VTKKRPISLNGCTFFVTHNLEDALHSLRCSSSTNQKPFWIDAICIDQKNHGEKKVQIQRMTLIYRDADQVVIWLGNYYDPRDDTLYEIRDRWGVKQLDIGSEELTSAALHIARVLENHLHEHPGKRERSFLKWFEVEPFVNRQAWAQLSKLFWRPWFERLWIIQELGVSRRAVVQWGRLEVPWIALEAAAKYILYPDVVPPIHIHSFFPWMGAHRVIQTAVVERHSIMTVLENTQEAECFDPRDKLFAISGILSPSDSEDIGIDYSISVERVYLKWARARILSTGCLDVLSACADSKISFVSPSWVPDLRRPWAMDKPLWARTYGLSRAKLSGDGSFAAGGGSYGIHNPFSEYGQQLSVAGYFIDRISVVGMVGDEIEDPGDPARLRAQLLRVIRSWETMVRTHIPLQGAPSKMAVNPQISIDGLLRTHMPPLQRAPSNLVTDSEPFIDVLLRGYKNWCNDQYLPDCYRIWRNSREDENEDTFTSHIQNDFGRILLPMIKGCQMFVTTSGHLGVVAENCHSKVGDDVYVLRGSNTPHILRWQEVNYRLMGPCYVFGYMDYDAKANPKWEMVDIN